MGLQQITGNEIAAGSIAASDLASNLAITGDVTISGLTVGKGGGAVASATVVGNGAMGAINTGVFNSAFGNVALAINTSGTENTAVGTYALFSNTTGSYNTAIGKQALATNVSGGSNTAVGTEVLISSTGSFNTALGRAALQANTTASNNTAVGYRAAYSNTTGTGLCAFGIDAMYSNTTGNFNSSFGRDALNANSTGANNTALGYQSMLSNTTASNNTAVGYQAGYSGTTGANNTALGYQSMLSNTTASNNTAVGYQALEDNTTGTNNCAVGRFALRNCTTGTENTALGTDAGDAITTGTDNTLVGYGSGYLITTGSKNTVLGAYSGNQGGLDIRTASNHIVLSDGDGNPRMYVDNNGVIYMNGGSYVQTSSNQNIRFPSTGGIGYVGNTTSATAFQISYNSTGAGVQLTSGATSWGTFSDSRLKNVTGTYTNALSDIAQLEPVKFTWKADTENKLQVGVIAQSVQNVVPEAVESSTIEMDGTEQYLTVRYTELIPLMIASIQELNAKVEAQALEIATLKGN